MSEKLTEMLQVPTNPEFDWSKSPDEQAEYVNPVTLKNSEIRWANAAIAVTEAMTGYNKQIGVIKGKLQDQRNALSDFEQELLQQFPAPASATKSLKLLDAYLRRVAFENGHRDRYTQIITEIRRLEKDLLLLEIKVDNCKQVWQTIKLAGEHAQTHLAFVKTERAQSGRFA